MSMVESEPGLNLLCKSWPKKAEEKQKHLEQKVKGHWTLSDGATTFDKMTLGRMILSTLSEITTVSINAHRILRHSG
jgi:hypothetical protein